MSVLMLLKTVKTKHFAR